MTCMSGWLALWVRASHCVIVTCHYSCLRGHRSNWRPKVMQNNMSFEQAFSCHMTHRGHFGDISITYNPLRLKIGLLSCQHYGRCTKSICPENRLSKNVQYLKAGPVQIQMSKVTLRPRRYTTGMKWISFLPPHLSHWCAWRWCPY